MSDLVGKYFSSHIPSIHVCYLREVNPQLTNEYQTQHDKFKSLLPKLETILKEVEPNRKKIDQVLKDFFSKKGKIIPEVMDRDSWTSLCKDCQQELKKGIKSAVDEIEDTRIREKFVEITQELGQIFTQIPKNIRDGLEKNEIELINQENKEIITERERTKVVRIPKIPIEFHESSVVV